MASDSHGGLIDVSYVPKLGSSFLAPPLIANFTPEYPFACALETSDWIVRNSSPGEFVRWSTRNRHSMIYPSRISNSCLHAATYAFLEHVLRGAVGGKYRRHWRPLTSTLTCKHQSTLSLQSSRAWRTISDSWGSESRTHGGRRIVEPLFSAASVTSQEHFVG